MAEDGNLQAHESTYSFFISLFKYGMVAVAIVVAFVIWMIAG